MRAIQIAEFGGADKLALADLPVPQPGRGEALVRIACAGVNFIYVYMRSGLYARSDTYKTPLPMTLGMEAAGTVEAVGPEVTEWTPGDRVAYCLARGSYADYAVAPTWRLVGVPKSMEFEHAAGLMLQGSRAHYLANSAADLATKKVCLIHAGAGGVGQLLIQLAEIEGAMVIATVGDERKAEIARSRGADHCILYRKEDFRERVLEITNGRGVDVVYDSIGQQTIHKSIRSLRRRGLCILFGASSGPVSSIEPIDLAEAGSVFF